MGGFTIDSCASNPEEHEFIPGSPRLTVTGEGVVFLAEHGCLPSLSLSAINDRSNADAVGKSIICLQAGWMVVQCIARLAYQLPITLLEVTTLGHVLCALFIYWFWWNKPLDIGEPVVISHPHIRQMAAFMVEDLREFYPPDPKSIPRQDPHGDSTRMRKEMAKEASSIFGVTLDLIHRGYDKINLRSLNWPRDPSPTFMSVITRSPKYEEAPPLSRGETIAWFAFTMASGCYGGLHLAAWFSSFPTPIETLLWRLSSGCVTSAGLFLSIQDQISFLLEYSMLAGEHWAKKSMFLRPFLWLSLILTCFYIFIVACLYGAYICSRAFLIIEAFISLRTLPVTAYDTAAWTQWIPHL